MTQKAVVIGGGAIGVASAYYLERSGWHVTVVDSGDIGRGCSYGNACLVTASHSHPIAGPGVISQALRWMLRKDSPFYVRPRLDPELLRWAWRFRQYCNRGAAESGYRALLGLSRLSLDLFEQLHEILDFFYERKGLLHVYLGEDAGDSAKKDRDSMESAGFAARLLDRDGVLGFEPALSERARAGLFIEGEAHSFSYGYVQALAASLEKGKADVLSNRAVSDVRLENGRVRGVVVQSPEEEIEADLVVLAAGSWTPLIAKKLGVSIPLQPAKGYSCTIDTFPNAPSVPLLMPETRVIVTPLGDKIRFGGTLELAGHDLSLDETRYRAVIRGAREVLKTSFEMKNEEPWCGLRPCLPDGLPIVDWVPGIGGLLVAAGHAMLGFTQSPGTGKVVAELANGETPSAPLEPFRFGRFHLSNGRVHKFIFFRLIPLFLAVSTFAQPAPATELVAEDYADLVHRCMQGQSRGAVRILSRAPREDIARAAQDYGGRWLSEPQIRAAVLLHTEAILTGAGDFRFHVDAARHWMGRAETSEREVTSDGGGASRPRIGNSRVS